MTLSAAFRALHAPGNLLVLANAWDAGSARLIESLGAHAVATTSAGVAWANGYPDGDAVSIETLAAAVRAIARVIAVPLTVDAEGGYADDPAAAAANVARLVDAGAVGINIEDGNAPPERHAAKIAAIKAAHGSALFVNARIDVYLKPLADGASRDAEVAARMARYRDAGADGLFVPGLVDPAEIAAAVAAARGLPVNLMALPSLPDARTLRELGVRRVSAGGAIASAALATARQLAGAFLAEGNVATLFTGERVGWAEMNALMPR